MLSSRRRRGLRREDEEDPDLAGAPAVGRLLCGTHSGALAAPPLAAPPQSRAAAVAPMRTISFPKASGSARPAGASPLVMNNE